MENVTPIAVDHQIQAIRPLVPLKLDKPRNLLLDFNALAYLEVERKKSVFDKASWKKLSAADARFMLRAALLHEPDCPNIRAVGKMIHSGNVEAIMTAIGEAWRLSAGSKDRPVAPLELSPADLKN